MQLLASACWARPARSASSGGGGRFIPPVSPAAQGRRKSSVCSTGAASRLTMAITTRTSHSGLTTQATTLSDQQHRGRRPHLAPAPRGQHAGGAVRPGQPAGERPAAGGRPLAALLLRGPGPRPGSPAPAPARRAAGPARGSPRAHAGLTRGSPALTAWRPSCAAAPHRRRRTSRGGTGWRSAGRSRRPRRTGRPVLGPGHQRRAGPPVGPSVQSRTP